MHVGCPFWGSVQGAHEVPQEEVLVLVFETQTFPHKWYPLSQTLTQPPATQVTLPLVGAVQTLHVFPHEAMLVLLSTTHVRFAPVPHE